MYLKREWAPLLSDKNTLTAERSNLRFGLIKSTGYKKEAQEYGIIFNIHDQTCIYSFILCGAGGHGTRFPYFFVLFNMKFKPLEPAP